MFRVAVLKVLTALVPTTESTKLELLVLVQLSVPAPVMLSDDCVAAVSGDAPSRKLPVLVSVVLAPIVSVLAVAADVLAVVIPATVAFAPSTSALPVLPVL